MAAATGPRVIATLYPLAFAAESVAPPGVAVVNLTPAGAEPHDLELAPDDVRAILGADLVVFVGGFQPAVDRVVAMRDGKSLDVTRISGLRLLEASPDGHQPAGAAGPRRASSLLTPGTADERAGGAPLLRADPHVWLDPRRYRLVARALASELGPDADASAFEARLAELDSEMTRGLSLCGRRELVTSHAAFGYLAERYGLRQVALAGLDPEAEPGPRDLERLLFEARRLRATTLFTEPLARTDVARTLARALGARTATLNPMEGLSPRQAARGEDYFSLMRANLAALREGLDCPPSSS